MSKPRAPCAHCKKEVERQPSQCRDGTISDKVFCNRGCYDAFRSGLRALRTATCLLCERSFIPPGGRPPRYCSEACWKAGKKAKPKHCVNCDCWFTPVKRHGSGRFISHNSGKTCSAECENQWNRRNPERKRKISAAFKGENHPNWQGGKAQLNSTSNRGPNWTEQRRKAIERDGRCLDCGITDAECVVRFGRSLDVDHVVPFHNFRDYRKANALSNLECRCASCHRIAEAKRTLVQMVLPLQESRSRMHKGYLRGERVNTAKLTAAVVLEMRAAHKRGEPLRAFADRYGVTKSAICSAVRGKSWKHLPL